MTDKPKASPRKIYHEPPINEAICDFQFEYENSWDWTIPGLLYEKISADFPKKEEQQNLSIGVDQNTGAQKTSKGIGRLRFSSDKRPFVLQVGPTGLTVNHLRPYTRWEEFSAVIKDALEKYWSIAKIKSISRVGLRYINQIEIPLEQLEISDYFNLAVVTPPGIPQLVTNYVIRQQIPFDEPKSVLLLTLSSAPANKKATSKFLLDIDFTTGPGQSLGKDETLAWLSKAKTSENLVFEQCITQKTKDLFGGVTNA